MELNVCNNLYYDLCRGFSTAHSIMISTAAVYFLVFSELFKDESAYGPVILRNSAYSKMILGVRLCVTHFLLLTESIHKVFSKLECCLLMNLLKYEVKIMPRGRVVQ